MTYNDIRKNENKGFSLVELIVVVAIMAVLVAVLAPSLLAYVERTRAQKDDSAMGEVTNAVMLALANQDAYDEALVYTRTNNLSSYADGDNKATATDANSEFTKGTAQWWFKDSARLKDEDLYALGGVMRGVTITFYPEASTKKSTFKLTDGIVNHLVDNTKVSFGGMTAGDGQHYLYNMVRATVGDQIELTSQTYRNSAYTVFIRMGTTGGAEAAKQDAIKVYGQWSGTNLSTTTTYKDGALQVAKGATTKG